MAKIIANPPRTIFPAFSLNQDGGSTFVGSVVSSTANSDKWVQAQVINIADFVIVSYVVFSIVHPSDSHDFNSSFQLTQATSLSSLPSDP